MFSSGVQFLVYEIIIKDGMYVCITNSKGPNNDPCGTPDLKNSLTGKYTPFPSMETQMRTAISLQCQLIKYETFVSVSNYQRFGR